MAQQTYNNLEPLFNVRTIINANATDAEARLTALEPSGPANGILRKGAGGQIEGFLGLTLSVAGSDFIVGGGLNGGSISFDFTGYASTLYKTETGTLMGRLYRDGSNLRLDESAGFELKINNVRLVSSGGGTNFLADDGTYKAVGGGGGTDENVKASPSDTTPGPLTLKLATSPGLSFDIQSPGGDEKFQFLNMASGGARQWTFDGTSIVPGNPGTGKFRMNNATQGSVTALYMSKNAQPEGIMTSLLAGLKAGDRIFVETVAGLKYRVYQITGTVTDDLSHMTIPVTQEFSDGVDIADNAGCSFGFYFTRSAGTSAGSANYLQTSDGLGGFAANINAQTNHTANLAEMIMKVPSLSGTFAGYLVNDESGSEALRLGYTEGTSTPRLETAATMQINTVGIPAGALQYTLPGASPTAGQVLKALDTNTVGWGADDSGEPSAGGVNNLNGADGAGGWNATNWAVSGDTLEHTAAATGLIRGALNQELQIATQGTGVLRLNLASGLTVDSLASININANQPGSNLIMSINAAASLTANSVELIASGGPLTLNGGTDTLTWPAADGNANEVLTTDGAGSLSWTPAASAGTSSIVTDNTAAVNPVDPGANSQATYVLTLAASRVVNLPATPTNGTTIIIKEGANSAAGVTIQLFDAAAAIETVVNGNIASVTPLATFTLQYDSTGNAWWII